MKRDYTIGNTEQAVTYFVGTEIERTPAYDMRTLFVVGVQDTEDIVKIASDNNCQHIYFGANQSFPNIEVNDARIWKQWEHMIRKCLENNYWCTLDLDVAQVEGLLEGPLVEYRRFIPQISVKIPYLTQLGYNATIKLDDIDFDHSNPGVWCHTLHSLTTRESFTDWDQYGKDEIIK